MRTQYFSHGVLQTAQYTELQAHAGGFLIGVQVGFGAVLFSGAAVVDEAYYRLWLGSTQDQVGQRLVNAVIYLGREAAQMSSGQANFYVPIGMKIDPSLPIWHDIGSAGGYCQGEVILYWK